MVPEVSEGAGRPVDEASGRIVPVASASIVLHDRYVTFRYVDGGSETYVLQDLVRALAEFAGIECEEVAS